jgi:hypothetical protein
MFPDAVQTLALGEFGLQRDKSALSLLALLARKVAPSEAVLLIPEPILDVTGVVVLGKKSD